MWHACGNYSVEGFVDGNQARVRELFERFERLIASCGPYEVAPAKTRVAFHGSGQIRKVILGAILPLTDLGVVFERGQDARSEVRGPSRIGRQMSTRQSVGSRAEWPWDSR
jgi:hypothetical protein